MDDSTITATTTTATPVIPSAGSSKNRGPRACTTCAKAKSRCHPGPTPSICERCHRLNKPCSSQMPAPPRRRREARPNRVAELERRLQDLTSRLQPVVEAQQQQQQQKQQQQQPSPPASSHPTLSQERHLPVREMTRFSSAQTLGPMGHLLPGIDAGSGSDPDVGPESAGDQPSLSGSVSPPAHGPSDIPKNCQAPRYSPEAASGLAPPGEPPWPDQAEAELLMGEYNSRMKELFPFVVVPPGMTSDQVRRERPFLWKALMVEALHMDGSRQLALGNRLLADIAAAALTAPSKTLDLLQGLQVMLAWMNYGFNSFQITNLLFLARSICVSLGFSDSHGAVSQTPLTSARLEEMRTFAGLYYQVTLTFATNRKPDALMSTSYLDACCDALLAEKEYPTDELAVYLVKIQQLTQSISQTFASFTNSLQVNSLPLNLIVKSFQQQLASFQQTLPETLRSSCSLTSHVHIAHILLYEVGLNLSDTPQKGPQQGIGPAGAAVPVPRAEKLELLWSCLYAVRAYMNVRFSEGTRVPTLSDPPRFCCLSSYDFVFAMLTGIKLLMLQAPGWDRAVVWRELDLDGVAGKMIEELGVVVQARQQGSARYFSRCASLPTPESVTTGACDDVSVSPVVGGKGAATPAEGGGGGSNATGPPEHFEILRQRVISIRAALRSEAPEVLQAYAAEHAGSVPSLKELVGTGVHEGVHVGDQQQQQQPQQQEPPPPPHMAMPDMDIDSWAFLFSADDQWDPSGTIPDWPA